MLKKLQFKPGINRDSTNLANEGGWWECDKIRFRSGYPEKIGGWTRFAASTVVGVIRSLANWVTLAQDNLLGVGTSKKFYIEHGNALFDITPVRDTQVVVNALTITSAETTVYVAIPGHGAADGDYVTISGLLSVLGGVPIGEINGEHEITLIDSNNFSFTVATVATSTVTSGGGSLTYEFQVNVGNDVATFGTGWSTGGWGRGTWGSGFTSSIVFQLRLWTHDNFGQDLIYGPRNGGLYYWSPAGNINTALGVRGVNLTTVPGASDVPLMAAIIRVTDDRHVVAFGTNDIGSTTQDPMFIRWSDQEDYANWTPAVTNTAGGQRLDTGSYIVTAEKTRQENLVWTDSALYSMQFIGPPYVFGFSAVAKNISIASPHAVAKAGDLIFWMGHDKFYAYTGRVETLPCTLWAHVFDDFNFSQRFQVFAGTVENYSEIWWFYCSADSYVVDRYVVFNYMERVWYYGSMERTAWLDSPLRTYPMAAATDKLVYHENGCCDALNEPTQPINAYIQSSDFDIDDGERFALIQRIIPDITFLNSTAASPSAELQVRVRRFPGSDYHETTESIVTRTATIPVERFNQQYWIRLRGRQMALRVESNSLGTEWQLGTPRLDFKPDGKR